MVSNLNSASLSCCCILSMDFGSECGIGDDSEGTRSANSEELGVFNRKNFVSWIGGDTVSELRVDLVGELGVGSTALISNSLNPDLRSDRILQSSDDIYPQQLQLSDLPINRLQL